MKTRHAHGLGWLFPLLIVLGLSLLPASALELKAQVDQPLAIGQQVFSAGTVEISPTAQGNTHAVLIDGQVVALVFRHTIDRVPRDADSYGLAFRVDRQGLWHLVGLRWTAADTGRTEERLFRFARISRGRTTLSARRR
ncbi:MAG: hypothetical protein Q9Q40_12580 [Acidobacteriota bacterium]|nr:hypothetical protein [Acidobacteriota bacterium]MDQ7088491.1 hypothetical protein [Acidobacteriota bacterium]